MSETNHTPGPYTYDPTPNGTFAIRGTDEFTEKGYVIAETLRWPHHEGRQEENARRIVACLNACRNCTTEEIEKLELAARRRPERETF